MAAFKYCIQYRNISSMGATDTLHSDSAQKNRACPWWIRTRLQWSRVCIGSVVLCWILNTCFIVLASENVWLSSTLVSHNLSRNHLDWDRKTWGPISSVNRNRKRCTAFLPALEPAHSEVPVLLSAGWCMSFHFQRPQKTLNQSDNDVTGPSPTQSTPPLCLPPLYHVSDWPLSHNVNSCFCRNEII